MGILSDGSLDAKRCSQTDRGDLLSSESPFVQQGV
jgi:hypothetical protein